MESKASEEIYRNECRGAPRDPITSRPSSSSAPAYWDFIYREATPNDLGHICRECRRPFTQLGAALAERRGARLALRYHRNCFSGVADPRSQPHGPFQEGKWAGSNAVSAAAPAEPFHKMRTARQFDHSCGSSSYRYSSRGGNR